jgi:hypothetical protein
MFCNCPQASTRLVFLFACLLQPAASPADTVAVRYQEGVSHGFLVPRAQDGKPIADGDSTQVARGDRVTSHMRFRFKDGSIYEENDRILAARRYCEIVTSSCTNHH